MDQKAIVAIIVVAIVGFGIGNYLGRANKPPFKYSDSKAKIECPSQAEIDAVCEKDGDEAIAQCEALIMRQVDCEEK